MTTTIPNTDRIDGAELRRLIHGLVYSAVSNTCTMASVLSKLPYNQTDRRDIAGVLDELNRNAA